MDKAVLGYCRLGYFRLGVFDDNWARLVKTAESLGAASLNATRKRLMLTTRDSVTGWYNKAYESSDIEIILLSKAAQHIALACGTYVRGDFLGLTGDVLEEGDQIHINNQYYQVETVQTHYLGDNFSHRECSLKLLPFENLTGANYIESTVQDARYRTKVYLETYLDDNSLPTYIIAYGKPDYPITKIFKEKGVDLVFAVGTPESEALLVGVGYEEHVPITIWCIDKLGITGTKLRWKAEAELRRVVETYPAGSLRTLTRLTDNEKNLGGTILYSVEYVMSYVRFTP